MPDDAGGRGSDGRPARRRRAVPPARLIGLLLFLPVPLVLILFTRLPFGGISILAGLLLMATHQLYARPWAARRSGERCLWCGRSIPPSATDRPGAGLVLTVADPRGVLSWGACGEAHLASAVEALRRAWRQRLLLRAGILGALVLYLGTAIPASLGWIGPITTGDASAIFRFGIAVTVLIYSWPWPARRGTPGGPLRAPFPMHVPALIGVATVLWLFRLVGFLWLVQSIAHLARRSVSA